MAGHAISSRPVEVAIPKFRAESEFSLKEALSQMGMPTAFTGRADFSGIDGRHDLAISGVQHKAFVDVSEEGTEAAAATGVAVALVAMKTPPRTVFRADHPFLFLIRDTRSGAILFTGRLMSSEVEGSRIAGTPLRPEIRGRAMPVEPRTPTRCRP